MVGCFGCWNLTVLLAFLRDFCRVVRGTWDNQSLAIKSNEHKPCDSNLQEKVSF